MDRPRRRIPVIWILIALLPVGLLVWWLGQIVLGSKLVVGTETTFVTAPRRPDGRIDYPAALHQHLSKGVDRDNNAAILLDRALGPSAITPEFRTQYFEWIGVQPLPDSAEYAITQGVFVEQMRAKLNASSESIQEMHLQFRRAQQKPWTRPDFALVSDWIDANRRPFDLIEQAAQRSEYYAPLVDLETPDLAISMVQPLREVARMFIVRSMLRLGENNVDGAWSDLSACHRLAQLVIQRAPSNLTFQVAVAVHSAASSGDSALLAHGLTAEQARKYLEEHAKLRPPESLADVLNYSQRLQSLEQMTKQSSEFMLDVNTMLRKINSLFDELVTALRKKDIAERKEALTQIENSRKERVALRQRPMTQFTSLLTSSRRAEAMADHLFQSLIASVVQADTSQTRTQIRHDLVQIGFALAGYRSEHGNYPERLDELVPGYLVELPIDRFNKADFVYSRRENGFLIYSLGPNGADNGGRMDSKSGEDDIALENPPRFDE